MITVNVITGLPGSGKTKKIVRHMARTKGRYLFVTSRIDLINERIKNLRKAVARAGTQPTIVSIHSPVGGGYRSIPVLAEIEEAPALHQHEDHVVIFITHEAMMGARLDGFRGWHAIIDENPAAISSNVFDAPATAVYLEAAFDIVGSKSSKWSRLLIKPDAPSPSDILNDTHLKGLATFDKRARSPQGVYVDVDDWAKVKGSTKPLMWWSLWTPLELAAFESVTVAGAGYFKSLGYKATMVLFADKVRFVEQKIVSPKRACPRVAIHYFTKHKGSTKFWAQEVGRDCLLKILDHLKLVPDLGYWATNDMINDLFVGARLSGQRVSPRQEGTNGLIHHTACALIYSAKATPGDHPSLDAFGLTKRDVERAREIEDIIQFALRGALRDPKFGGTYTVYLYSLDQAQALADYLKQEGSAQVDLVPVEEARIMEVEREKPGPDKSVLDERSREEKKANRRAADNERKRKSRQAEKEWKRENGMLRSRGRPKRTEALSPQTKGYRRSIRLGLTRKAYKARYCWKEDLFAIREREAAEALEAAKRSKKSRR